MFQSTMSMEQRKDIYRQFVAAKHAGNNKLAEQLAMQIPLSLPMARVLKADWGIERLKQSGFNLDDAVAAYGEDWLNG